MTKKTVPEIDTGAHFRVRSRAPTTAQLVSQANPTYLGQRGPNVRERVANDGHGEVSRHNFNDQQPVPMRLRWSVQIHDVAKAPVISL